MNKYEDIFVEARSRAYHEAMTEIAPDARVKEFSESLKHINPSADSIILDYPSGGGYMKRYVNAIVIEADPGNWDGERSHIESCAENSADYIVSIAGLHHYSQKQRAEIYKHFHRVLKGAGELVITEVADSSDTANFLNVFVNEFNSQGHEGIFFRKDEKDILLQQRFAVTTFENTYTWDFDNREQMIKYLKALFFLDKASSGDIDNAVAKYLYHSERKIMWQTVTYHCTKSPDCNP
jgi:SAM-dependent methyltransferase